MNQSIDAKVVILGSQSVGKTSFAMRVIGQKFQRHMSPTIGASYFSHKIYCDNSVVKFQIWDTAGQERFKSMAPMYYRNSKAAIIIFDITSYESFLSSHSWVKELKRNIDEPILLYIIGNKSDLQSDRKVPLQEAVKYTLNINGKYYETSALTNEGISDVFLSIANQLIDGDKSQYSHNSQLSNGIGITDSLDHESENIVAKSCC